MICNVCQINEGRSYTRKNKEGKLITVNQPICKQCLANKSHKFPEHITKEFLIHEHIDLNKSALTIAKENNTSESKISGQLKQFEITEIIHCKDCDTTENLITRIINNQFNKPIIVTQKICYKCHKEKQGKTISETRQNESEEQKAKRREATRKYYENNPEQKINETQKRAETLSKKAKKIDTRIVTAVCKICNQNCYGDNGLSIHLSQKHLEVSQYEYYLKYLGNEEKCLCGNNKKFINTKVGFAKTCCNKECINENFKSVCLDKYGVEYPLQSELFQEKSFTIKLNNIDNQGLNSFNRQIINMKETCLNKYGVNSPSQIPEVVQKQKETKLNNIDENGLNSYDRGKLNCKKTCLERYGVEFPMQSKEIVETRKYNNLEKYGTVDPSHLPDAIEKRKQTCLKIYGTEHPQQSEIVIEKIKEGLLKAQEENGEEIQEKRKQTCLKKYNVDHHRKNEEINYKIIQSIANRTEEQKKEQIKKQINTREMNQRKHGNSNGEGAKAKEMFDILIEAIVLHDIPFNILLKEKIVYVGNISEKFFARFLDLYIKINNREINFEFDEKGHENTKGVDLIREKEILFNKPNLEIYRVKEKQWDENPQKVIQDLIGIIKGEVYKEYSSLSNQ